MLLFLATHVKCCTDILTEMLLATKIISLIQLKWHAYNLDYTLQNQFLLLILIRPICFFYIQNGEEFSLFLGSNQNIHFWMFIDTVRLIKDISNLVILKERVTTVRSTARNLTLNLVISIFQIPLLTSIKSVLITVC